MEENNIHNELFGDEAPSSTPPPIKRLQRSADNSIITGVCGGIAEYFGKDVATVRIIAAMLLLLGAWIIAAYLIIAYLLPSGKHNEELTAEETHAISKENFKTILSSLFIVIGLHFSFRELGFINTPSMFFLPNSFMFPLFAIATGVFLLMNKFSRNSLGPVEPRNFYRAEKDKYILGVCGGIGNYLELDSSSLRIIFVLLTGLTFGLFSTAYLIIAIKTPLEPTKHIFADE